MNASFDVIKYVSIGLTVVWALIILFSVFKGFRRGVIRQSIRTATVIFSAVLAIILIRGFSANLIAACDGNTVAEAIGSMNGGESVLTMLDAETLSTFESLDAQSILNLVVIPTAAIAFPIAFTVLFILISAAFYIIYGIVCIFVKPLSKKNNTGMTRLFGALVGLVQGALVAAIFFLPVNNLLDLADSAAEPAREGGEESALVEIYDGYVEPVYNLPMRASMALGGRFLANTVATVELDGESYNARTPFLLIADILNDASKLEGADIDQPFTKNDQEIIRGIGKKLFDDKFFTASIAGLLSQISGLAENGIIDLEIDGSNGELYASFLEFFKSSNESTVERDFDTVLDVSFFMINEGAMDAISEGDDDAIAKAMTKTVEYNGKNMTVMRHIIAMLDENPHTKPIVTALTKLSLTVMSEHLGFGDALDEVHEELKADVDALNACETRSEIKDTIDGIFANHNIHIDDDILVGMTEYVFDEYTSNGKDITEDDMNNIVFSYYDAYAAAGY